MCVFECFLLAETAVSLSLPDVIPHHQPAYDLEEVCQIVTIRGEGGKIGEKKCRLTDFH